MDQLVVDYMHAHDHVPECEVNRLQGDRTSRSSLSRAVRPSRNHALRPPSPRVPGPRSRATSHSHEPRATSHERHRTPAATGTPAFTYAARSHVATSGLRIAAGLVAAPIRTGVDVVLIHRQRARVAPEVRQEMMHLPRSIDRKTVDTEL